MAFLCEASRNLIPKKELSTLLGPGHYNTQICLSKPRQFASAPFNSSTVKRSIYDKKVLEQGKSDSNIGPGSYQINQFSFIKDNIKTYTNRKSVIVKINSMGSKEFKSKIPRFKSIEVEITGPGPGSYDSNFKKSFILKQTKRLALQRKKLLKQRLHQSLNELKRDKKISFKPSIPNKSVHLYKKATTSQYKSTQENYNRKQNYSDKKLKLNQQTQNYGLIRRMAKGYTWSKSERNFFSQDSRNLHSINLGPGKYFIDKNKNTTEIISKNQTPKYHQRKKVKTQSSNFKSKTIRTFFDKICFDTLNKDIAVVRTFDNYKSIQPGPGFYDNSTQSTQNNTQNKYNTIYQFFGSTVERFPSIQQDLNNETKLNQNRHNPYYSTFIGQNKSFNKKNHAFLSQQQRKTLQLQNSNIPGPGYYDIKNQKNIFKPKKGKVVQNFGSSLNRFQQQNVQNLNLYLENIENQGSVQKKKQTQESFIFKSKTQKGPLNRKQQIDQLFGKYNTSLYDLSTKIQKQKVFQQNLKKIQVELPAFNSSMPRFETQKQKRSKTLQHYHLAPNAKHQSKKDNDKFLTNMCKSQKIREKALQKNKQQVTLNRRSTLYNKKQGFSQCLNDQDRHSYIAYKHTQKKPSVGDYCIRENWNKKSYNIKYSKNIQAIYQVPSQSL